MPNYNSENLKKLFLDMMAREHALRDIAEKQEEYVEERPHLQLHAPPFDIQNEGDNEPDKKRVIIIDL